MNEGLQQLRYDYRVIDKSQFSTTIVLDSNQKLLRFACTYSKFSSENKGSKLYYAALRCEARLKQEISCLKELNHSNINRLLPIPAALHFLEGAIAISTYYDQDLTSVCDSHYQHGRASCADLLQSLLVIYGAVAYMHQKAICHRNVCPQKIRLKSQASMQRDWWNCIVLCGFKDASRMSANSILGRIGSLRYLAPEMLQNLPYSEKVDVWSATCSISSFVFTQQERHVKDVKFRMLMNNLGSEGELSLTQFASRDPMFVSFHSIICNGLRQNPVKRSSARSLRESVLQFLSPPKPNNSGNSEKDTTQSSDAMDWRKDICQAFVAIIQKPLRTSDVHRITQHLSVSKQEIVKSWFKHFRTTCSALSIDATGSSAAAAFSMTQSDAAVNSIKLDKNNPNAKKRKLEVVT